MISLGKLRLLPQTPLSNAKGYPSCIQGEHWFGNKRSCFSSLFNRKAEVSFHILKKQKFKSHRICAASTKISIPSHGYDYYELLAVDSTAPISEIKSSYRWLQKRCHPDVAGEIGHQMAILLNEAYGVLSNHSKRTAYDQVRAYWLVDDSFTSKPLYSVWEGPESEVRAVFVDEVQCIGCLKCAVIASNTFAIENSYGRARAIRQWGDDETTINEAINSCPVDCIKWVEKTKLPVLEYLMSKQARFIIGINAAQSGLRMPEEIFTAAEKFLRKRAELLKKHSSSTENADENSREAAEGIRVRSGRWWDIFVNRETVGYEKWTTVKQSQGALVPSSLSDSSNTNHRKGFFNIPETGDNSRHFIPHELRKIHEAAHEQRSSEPQKKWDMKSKKENGDEDDLDSEYWIPSPIKSCAVSFSNHSDSPNAFASATAATEFSPNLNRPSEPASNQTVFQKHETLGPFPYLTSLIAGVWVYSTANEPLSHTTLVIDSPLPPLLTSGLFSQLLFAMAIWYCVGSIISGVFLMARKLMESKEDHF